MDLESRSWNGGAIVRVTSVLQDRAEVDQRAGLVQRDGADILSKECTSECSVALFSQAANTQLNSFD